MGPAQVDQRAASHRYVISGLRLTSRRLAALPRHAALSRRRTDGWISKLRASGSYSDWTYEVCDRRSVCRQHQRGRSRDMDSGRRNHQPRGTPADVDTRASRRDLGRRTYLRGRASSVRGFRAVRPPQAAGHAHSAQRVHETIGSAADVRITVSSRANHHVSAQDVGRTTRGQQDTATRDGLRSRGFRM